MNNEYAIQQQTEFRDLVHEMDCNFERFPLPICFEPREELKELNLRKWHIEEIAKRFLRMKKFKGILDNLRTAAPGSVYTHTFYKTQQ